MRQLMLIPALAFALPVLAADLVGEWSTEPNNCDELRVIYSADGAHPTKVNAGGEWVVVNESTWERDGDVILVTTGARTDAWDIVELDEERLHLANQDPEAAEHGAAESELYRCEPR